MLYFDFSSYIGHVPVHPYTSFSLASWIQEVTEKYDFFPLHLCFSLSHLTTQAQATIISYLKHVNYLPHSTLYSTLST